MIPRHAKRNVLRSLAESPAVAVLGPRQIGKTTLARDLADDVPASLYLDLEDPRDAARLTDPARYLDTHSGKLVVLDEIQQMPDIFRVLRGQIDQRRREGLRSGQFLLLGSSNTLMRRSSEFLAGRVVYDELSGLTALEVGAAAQQQLWVRGGFPDAFRPDDDGDDDSDEVSARWRTNFIRTYLERDVPRYGVRVPAPTLRRLWTMLGHRQGGLFNASDVGRSLSVSAPAVGRYVDLLVDRMFLRRLPPYFVDVGKRLVKAPKVYIRDSGVLHSLLGIPTHDDLLGHPVVGASWEGFAIENLLAVAPSGTEAYFYRTRTGAEIDLLLLLPDRRLWAVEVKLSSAPSVGKGFAIASEDVGADERFVVHSGDDAFPLNDDTLAIPLTALMERLAASG